MKPTDTEPTTVTLHMKSDTRSQLPGTQLQVTRSVAVWKPIFLVSSDTAENRFPNGGCNVPKVAKFLGE